MQNELQQMKQQMLTRSVSPVNRQQLMAGLRHELKFEKALMMAEVEQAMKQKENELLERLSARINLQGKSQLKLTQNSNVLVVDRVDSITPPDFMRTENMARKSNGDIVSRLSDNAVRAELDKMFIMRKLGLEEPK